MEQAPDPIPGIIRKPQPAEEPAAPRAPARPSSPYFQRMFEGRLNRQNYSFGTLLLLGFPLLYALIFFGSFFTASGALSWLLINPYDTHELQTSALDASKLEHSMTDLINSPSNRVIALMLVLYMLITLPLNIGMQVRRLHDMNNSGWLLLINLIPFVSYFFPFYVTFFSGTKGENKYGPPPLARVDIKNDILQIVDKK